MLRYLTQELSEELSNKLMLRQLLSLIKRYRLYYRVMLFSLLSRVRPFCNPMDYSHQASLSMKFSRQEYWHGLSFHSPKYFGCAALLVES